MSQGKLIRPQRAKHLLKATIKPTWKNSTCIFRQLIARVVSNQTLLVHRAFSITSPKRIEVALQLSQLMNIYWKTCLAQPKP